MQTSDIQPGHPLRTASLRALILCTVLVVAICGCSRHETERLAFDRLLASKRIDQIVIVEGDKERTNLIIGHRLQPLLARFAPSNRIANPIRSKSYISGHITFYERDQPRARLDYFPREQVLSCQGYEFTFRDTNDIASLFR